eukprot:2759979-Pyramimonas_sp.AAC.1
MHITIACSVATTSAAFQGAWMPCHNLDSHRAAVQMGLRGLGGPAMEWNSLVAKKGANIIKGRANGVQGS